ncbi:MAG: GAF domain-containing protein [Burkholderiales bacterium]|nr:GAF domain-containing protein [Burkholderiales bacterium]
MKSLRAGLFLKYFAIIGLLVTVEVAAIGAMGLYFSYQETRQSLATLQREKALTASVQIEHFLSDIERQLGWTAMPVVTVGEDPVQARILDFIKLQRQLQAVTEVSQLDGAGREQIKVSRVAMNVIGSGIDFSKDPRFIEARKGKTWFGPVYFRKETEPYMAIAIPEARDRPGVTVVDVNLKFIWEVVNRIRVGTNGYAYVVDDKGFLIAHPNISLVLKKIDLSALPQVKQAIGAPADAEQRGVDDARDLDGTPVFAAWAPVAATGWRVLIEEPQREVLAPVYAAILRTVYLLLGGIALSVLASVFLARRMVTPVRALQKGAERIGAGDLDGHIDVHTGDELEDLAGRFNDMAGQLKESYAGLERKVEERTAELREALSQQTATAEILRVISSSPTDVQPVFDAIVKAATGLGQASHATLVRFDGEYLHPAAHSKPPLAPLLQPALPSRGSLSGRVILDRKVLEIRDLANDPEYDFALYSHHGDPNLHGIGVPLLRDDEPIGVLNVWWPGSGSVPEKYARLLQTFASQAVIAIENVRLFNETQDKSRLLEAANKHKSEFLANMSHELRTPLNAIIGFSEVMLNGMAGPMSDEQKEFAADIRDSGKHLLTLINDILDLSKIEAGRMELDVAPFDLPMAMHNAMTLVQGRAERSGIRLETQIAPTVSDYEGDERKFKQIVINLLSNAVKFTPEGGKVTLAAVRVNGAYSISVRDTGIGIAADDQEKIFEEFKQVGTDYARKAEGTGLGLTLTRKLVELHGGTITVESAPGSGSTFTFTLPIEA